MRLIKDIENDIQNKQTELDQTTHEIQKSILVNAIAALEVEKKQAEEQQERAQAQTEAIESISLPYDYNELLGNPMANDTIIENVKQFQLQAYEEHNAEVARINAAWQAKLTSAQNTLEEIAADRTVYINENERLKDLIGRVEKANDVLEGENETLKSATEQFILEKEQALLYRDNAVNQLEEANEELEKHKQSTIENCDLRLKIEALEQELTAKKAITVSGNEKLAELAAKAKESTAAAAQRGIDRWNEKYGMDIPVLATPAIPFVNEATRQDEAATDKAPNETDQVDADTAGENQAEQGNQALHAVVGQTESEDMKLHPDEYLVTMRLFNSLNARVELLEAKLVA